MTGVVGYNGLMFGGIVITPTNRLSITNTPVGTASTTHNVAMPSGTVTTGDLLLCQFTIPSNSAITTPSGWTLLALEVNTTAVSTGWWYKVAAGTESGTTVNWVTAASVQAIGTVHQIQNGTYGSGLLAIAGNQGTSANPQSPEIPIPWGTTQNTILTAFGSNFNAVSVSYPATFGGGDWQASAATTGTNTVASHASAIKTDTVPSIAPGAFTQNTSRAFGAHTLLIGPNGTPALSGPVVLSTTNSDFVTDTTSHLVAMPAIVNAGDLLMALVATHDTSTVTTPSGWTQLVTANTGGAALGAQFGVYYKLAAGTEGGTTVDFVTSAAQRGAMTVYRIQAGTFASGTAPEISTVATGSSVSPLPNTITPSWGTADTLFIAAVGANNRRAFTSTVYGYSNAIQAGATTASSVNAQTGSAYALYRNATSWTAAFTITNAQNWIAYTIAIKPV